MLAVFDIECDELYDKVTKIHCLSYTYDGKEIKTIFNTKDIIAWIEKQKFLVGHNIVRYDIPTLEKLLGVKIKAKLYDTLAMAWVMFPARPKYGLESFGPDYGFEKPKIDDWQNLSPEEYQHRCEEDVKINWALWRDLIKRFKTLYGTDKKNLDRHLQYLSFKMKCAFLAEKLKWRLDKKLAQESFDTLEKLQEEKVEELIFHMPSVAVKKLRHKPQWRKKKDGSLFKSCLDWLEFLKEEGLPEDHPGPVEIITGYEQPNPNSPEQVKAWLFGLGWKPCTFNYVKEDDGSERTIPQIRYSTPGHPRKGELTDSVRRLIDDNKGVEVLDGLTVIQHRKAIFKGFLEYVDEDGYVKAEINGLTNTLRFQHKAPLVNLPGVDKPWGKEVRGCLIAPEGKVLCGSDMASLESTTKRHFLYPYDPDYVEEMSQPGFDEHLDLALRADYLTKDDYDFYSLTDPDNLSHNELGRYKDIKSIRTKFKPVNYSSVYGVGKVKMSRTTGMSETEAEELIKAYWKRNKGIKEFAEDVVVKTLNNQMWVWNPVSKFWYTLRYKKDIFSTINQGTGAYCFDTWLGFCIAQGVLPCGQFHDEFITPLDKGDKDVVEQKLRKAIAMTNKKLNLNVPLDIDIQFGSRYSEIH